MADEHQTILQELRQELLDQRAMQLEHQTLQLNRWLAVIAIVLTTFGIAIPVLGYIGYREIADATRTAQQAKVRLEVAEQLAGSAEATLKKVEEQLTTSSSELAKIEAEAEDTQRMAINAGQILEGAEEKVMGISTLVESARDEAARSAQIAATSVASDYEKEFKKLAEELNTQYRNVRHLTENLDVATLAEVFYSLGKTKRLEKDVGSAFKFYNLAIKINDRHALVYHSRGVLYVDDGRLEAAIRDFDQAIALDANFAKAYLDRGKVKRVLGRGEEALTDVRKAMEIGQKTEDGDIVSESTVELLNLGTAIR